MSTTPQYIGVTRVNGSVINDAGGPTDDNGMATKAYVDKTWQYFVGDGTTTPVALDDSAIAGSTVLIGHNAVWHRDPDDGSFPTDTRWNQAAYKEVIDINNQVTHIEPNIRFPSNLNFMLGYCIA